MDRNSVAAAGRRPVFVLDPACPDHLPQLVGKDRTPGLDELERGHDLCNAAPALAVHADTASVFPMRENGPNDRERTNQPRDGLGRTASVTMFKNSRMLRAWMK